MSPPEIFSRAARRLRRDRAATGWPDHAFVRAAMLDGIADRLATVKRSFADALDLGCFDGSLDLGNARVARLDADWRDQSDTSAPHGPVGKLQGRLSDVFGARAQAAPSALA